jgi:MFS family permease
MICGGVRGCDVVIAVLLLLLFFLSGISGLIYQVLWLRLLALVFGVTVYAASAVLASFMAGLASGSFIAGRLVDRARYPLLWYSLVEVLVGLSALATPAALDGIERLYAAFYPALPPRARATDIGALPAGLRGPAVKAVELEDLEVRIAALEALSAAKGGAW